MLRGRLPRTGHRSRCRWLHRRYSTGLLLLLLPAFAFAQIPPGYYESVDDTTAATLRATLHAVIDDHQRFPYSSSSEIDTWDILELADEDPGNLSNILDVYKNASYPKHGGSGSNPNREHTWPQSYGFPDEAPDNYPRTDCHHLFLSDNPYNGNRGNLPFRTCSSGCSERTTLVNNGQGGGSGTYPGNSNWHTGTGNTGSWETWIGRRGDVARALLYMDLRYEGGTHGGTGFAEPDLVLTDDDGLIQTSGGVNAALAYMGILSVLLEWTVEDPVDAVEIHRNEVVYSFQGNRNPFIDHPDWAACLFQNACFLFNDGFEAGDATAWSLAVP
jgi:endonuclease I